MLCHNFLIGKGHTCALRTTREDTRQSDERGSDECRATHTYTLATALHYNVCEHVGLDTNQSLRHPPERDVLG
jgi:hypothetical protein